MKLPFDFGLKLIFRLILPGFILTLGLVPFLRFFLGLFSYSDKFEYPFVVTLILTGWLFTMSDMAVYIVYEGRRYWPKRLRAFCMAREERRLAKIRKRLDDYRRLKDQPGFNADDHPEEYRAYIEAYDDIENFPKNGLGEYFVAFPTRLGNMLRAVEDHPLNVHGLNSVFYWYRIWLGLDKDTREELDNRQAIADSAVYTSAAFFCDGALYLCYALLLTAHLLAVRFFPGVYDYLPAFKVTVVQHLPHVSVTWLLAFACPLIGFAVYRLSLRLHATSGEFFKSVFDVYGARVDVSGVMEDLARRSKSQRFLTLSRRGQLHAAWRYLQYYKVKCPHCGKIISAALLEAHARLPAPDANAAPGGDGAQQEAQTSSARRT